MDSNNNRPNPLIARGTVICVLPVQEGVSKAGNAWRKGAFVIETESQYPRTICFNIWNNRIDEYALTEGDFVEVRFDVESREYMERWYCESVSMTKEPLRQALPDLLTPSCTGRTRMTVPLAISGLGRLLLLSISSL